MQMFKRLSAADRTGVTGTQMRHGGGGTWCVVHIRPMRLYSGLIQWMRQCWKMFDTDNSRYFTAQSVDEGATLQRTLAQRGDGSEGCVLPDCRRMAA